MDSYIPDTPKPGKENPFVRPPPGTGRFSSYRGVPVGYDDDDHLGALALRGIKTHMTREIVPPNQHDQVDLSRFSLSPALDGSGLTVRPASGRHDSRNQSQQGTVNYFSTLTQKFQPNHGTDHKAKVSKPLSGIAAGSLLSRPVLDVGFEDRGKPDGHPQREPGGCVNDSRVGGSSDWNFRGTIDSMVPKLNSLNEKIQSQTQEITELRFSLNDADVATAALEAEKRRLKHRNEDLERKIRESQTKTTHLVEDIKQLQEALLRSTKEKNVLQREALSMAGKSATDQKRLADAQSAVQEAHAKLEATRSEMQRDMDAAMAQSRANIEAANERVKGLTLDVQHREEELQFQKEANSRLSKQLDEIPDRNFQAMSACVKKVFEKLDKSQIELLTDSRAASEGQTSLMRQIGTHIGDVLAASQQHGAALSAFQEKIVLLETGVSKMTLTTEESRAGMEKGLREALDGGLQGVQRNFGMWQAEILQKLDKKNCDTDVLVDVCKKRDMDSEDLSKMLSDQARVQREQLQLTRGLQNRLQTLEDSSQKDQNTAALIELLQEEKSVLEAKVQDQEAQILELETNNKQKTDALVEAGDRFAEEVQQLGALYRQREEEYRRVQEQASELAHRETRIYLDESKQDTQRELQQERAKRQELERHLRQAKEEVLVLEESYRRCGQSLDALQQELSVTRHHAQGVTEHLEEKVRVLELERDGDRTVIARLKALLADKEMDYGNLKNSMKVYDEKVGTLMEHLRGWAQDYRHIGAIRSRLEMLGQIDQSCAATARIREAEQIDSVLAHLRQYCATTRDGPADHVDLKRSHLPSSETSDGTHEKRIADLSALLDLDTSHTSTAETAQTAQDEQDACASGTVGGTLQTPVAGVVHHDTRGTHPPSILHDRRTRRRTMLEQQAQMSIPVLQRAQRAGMQKRRHADLEAQSLAEAAERRPKRKQPEAKDSSSVRNTTPAQDAAACESQEDVHETDGNASPSVTTKSEDE